MAEKFDILLVEDTASLAHVYLEYLNRGPYRCVHVSTGKEAIALALTQPFAAILLDLRLPDMSGLEVMREIAEGGVVSAVIVITAYGSINTAVEAMRAGAYDFLVKPFAPQRLLVTLQNALERHRLTRIVNTYTPPAETQTMGGFIGSSLPMKGLYRTIEIAAQSKAPVFVTGESGTGKELCAEAIHQRSHRAERPFVALNCAALPKDLIESEVFGHIRGAFTGAVADREGAASRARGGTLFLDEICEMDVSLQAKLLRFLQTGMFQRVGGSTTEEADVRIICATNRDPLKEVHAGRFREDLYYRLYVVPIDMPPLRDRGEDVLVLARHFLSLYAREEGRDFAALSQGVERAFMAYPWPGNVRQLQNVIRQIVLMNTGRVVTEDMLPPALSSFAGAASGRIGGLEPTPGPSVRIEPRFSIELMELDLIEAALERCDGNVQQAAVLLDVSPSTIYRKRQTAAGRNHRPRPVGTVRPLAEAERDLIETAVEACSRNIARAAAELGINPSTLYRKMQAAGLDRDMPATTPTPSGR